VASPVSLKNSKGTTVNVPGRIVRGFVLAVSALLALAGAPRVASAPIEQQSGMPGAAAHALFLPLIARARDPIGFVTTPAELQATKRLADLGLEPSRGAMIRLMRVADRGLAFAPCAVATYTSSAGGECLNRSAQYAYALALVGRISVDPRYGSQAAAILRAWYTTLAAIDAQDSQAKLEWSRLGPALIWAADLLDGTSAWSEEDRRQFIAMLVGKLLAPGKEITHRANNWADAGNLLWLSIAIYADLPAERDAAIASWKLKLDGLLQTDGTWAYGMLPDGSLAEEDRRGASGLAYNQGALSLKTVFAEIVRRQGDSSLYLYRSPRGVGLKNGWDFLAQQVVDTAAGLCTWPYTSDHCVSYANKSGWEIAYARWREPAYLGPIALDRPYQWSDAADPGYSTLLFANLDLSSQ
jgi:hypothetical protein